MQEKHQIQIKETVKILSMEIQRLKKSCNCCFIRTFKQTLDLPLINCEVSLILTWSESWVLNDITTQAAVAAQGNNPGRPEINAATNAIFQIKDTKLYVPVVTLSTGDDNKLLEQLRTGFERSIKWNKYRSKMTNQNKNNNLNYLIDP